MPSGFGRNEEGIAMQIPLTEFGVTFEVADAAIVQGRRAPAAPNLPNPAQSLRDALENPRNFPPFRRAILPDDLIAVVVDDRLPRAGELVISLLNYITEAGVAPDAITLISVPGSTQSWVDELPDEFQDVRTEVHDPTDRKRLAYVASTRKGKRIYLNRNLIDAGQAIFLGGCRYDPLMGHTEAASLLYPGLSEADALKEADHHFSAEIPGDTAWPLRQEAEEVAWLIGVPFLVDVVDGSGNGISHIVGGTVEVAKECRELLHARWQIAFPRPAQIAVATVGGDASQQDFESLARAALCAARVVEPGGRVVILSHANPKLGDGAMLLRETENPAVAERRIQESRPADRIAARMWLEAARRANLYLLSELPEETVEEMFATPLQKAIQAQRLIDAASSCLFIEEANKSLAVLSE
jgi:nickel-dependent lactate racemase